MPTCSHPLGRPPESQSKDQCGSSIARCSADGADNEAACLARRARPSLLTVSNVCAADANILINSCRLAAQQYLFAYQEPIPVDQLVRTLCDQKQVRCEMLKSLF